MTMMEEAPAASALLVVGVKVRRNEEQETGAGVKSTLLPRPTTPSERTSTSLPEMNNGEAWQRASQGGEGGGTQQGASTGDSEAAEAVDARQQGGDVQPSAVPVSDDESSSEGSPLSSFRIESPRLHPDLPPAPSPGADPPSEELRDGGAPSSEVVAAESASDSWATAPASPGPREDPSGMKAPENQSPVPPEQPPVVPHPPAPAAPGGPVVGAENRSALGKIPLSAPTSALRSAGGASKPVLALPASLAAAPAPPVTATKEDSTGAPQPPSSSASSQTGGGDSPSGAAAAAPESAGDRRGDDDDDVISQAAVTYAALAAAATANHRSPAEAARSARMAAQTILFQQHGGGQPQPQPHQPSSAESGRDDADPLLAGTAAGRRTTAFRSFPLSRATTVLREMLAIQPMPMPPPFLSAAPATSDTSLPPPPTPETKGENSNAVRRENGAETVPVLASLPARAASGGSHNASRVKGGGAGSSSRILRHMLHPEHMNVGLLKHVFWLNYCLLVDDDGGASDAGEKSVGSSGGLSVVAAPAAAVVGAIGDPVGRLAQWTDEDEAALREACVSACSLLHKIESAYESLVSMLPSDGSAKVSPPSASPSEEGDGARILVENEPPPPLAEDSDYETPVIVPDLLPPCTTPRGDATLAFFCACVGPEESAADATAAAQQQNQQQPRQRSTPDSVEPHQPPSSPPRSTNIGPAPSSPEKGASSSTASFLSMFKRASLTSSGPTASAAAAAAPATTGSLPATGAASAPGVLGTVFRKKGSSFRSLGASARAGGAEDAPKASGTSTPSSGAPDGSASASATTSPPPGCYTVKIEREMLGLTVENVLERTVVRTVLPGGPAKKAGAQVGSLITAVGTTETRNLTHFETIDELRQSQRPLVLMMKHVGDDALRMAREEMGRLIRGAGFGIVDEDRPGMRDARLDVYNHLIKLRWDAAAVTIGGGGAGVDKLGEKLVWILTLFVVGLEREADRLQTLHRSENGPGMSPRRRHSVYSHTSQDYADAARSVGKVLWDYARKKLQLPQQQKPLPPPPPPPPPISSRRAAALHPPGRPLSPVITASSATTSILEKPLLQIGDVLQRARIFLADTTSPPAALLRGELISFLCDVLDADTEMELAEEESLSSSLGGGSVGGAGGVMGGGGSAMINDLGSAGSLLKLIVLNAPIMRSSECDAAAIVVDEGELRRRFGPRDSAFTADDVHRLHAGNRFLSVVHRLAASRSTSARITACSLGPVLWGHLDFPHQLQLRGVITRALHDVEVIVRKSTATVLHEIAELVFDRRCVPWLVLMCERAMTDPEPQLRSAAMTLTWHLAEHLPNAFLGNASQGSRYLRRLPSRDDPIFADVYLLQCKLLPVATRLAEDRSPSVRLAVAAQCDRLCDALGDHWSSVIIDVLLALLSDSDERVRCEAVACVPRLSEIVLLSVSPGAHAVSEVSILEALIPASMKLQNDPSSSVRVALAATAGELLGLLVLIQARVMSEIHILDSSAPAASSRQSSSDSDEASRKYKRQVDDRMIPLLQTLLNDKDPEVTSAALRAVTNATRRSVQQVRHRHMSTTSLDDDAASLSSYHSHASDNKNATPVLTPVLSETQVLRLLPTLSELADSRQWRVRQSAVEIVPALLGCTSQMKTRQEISKLCVRLMSDEVDAVRRSAAECLCMGGSSLGSHGEDASAEWMTLIVVPAIRTCAAHSNSKQRLLSLKMVQTVLISGACPARWKGGEDLERMADTPMRELASIALSLTTDRIANVRLNVGRSLEPVLHVFEDDDIGFIQQVLLQQMDQERHDAEVVGPGDRDVLFFANSCVQKAKQILDDRVASGDDTNSRLSC